MRDSFLFGMTVLSALVLAGGLALAQTQQDRLSGLQLSGDQPIQIESDRLEIRDDENTAFFSGNVSVTQGTTVMRSGTMTVYYAGNGGTATGGTGDIERLEVAEGVYVRSQDQVATGDQGTFDMRTEILVLTGREVVLTEGDNVIMGCKLTVEMASGRAQLDGCTDGSGTGRVKMLLQPGSQDR